MSAIDGKNYAHSKGGIILVLLLTNWFGFAATIHQFDILPLHHVRHDCHQFSTIYHATVVSHIVIPVVVSHGYPEPIAETIRVSRSFSAYDARSPPITGLSVNLF
jgi:hypothetical protein